ncbi:subtilisin-like protease SBT1.1 [Juglans regia]|uniref:Subtilisin-like protease SBT1.1 n=1 Tax=Juglans regia TaxID=51240 RepID=A0A6P9EXZ5_JUGRE|nr:subtilisin-like protease SBT1.1 [Juglans regia]
MSDTNCNGPTLDLFEKSLSRIHHDVLDILAFSGLHVMTTTSMASMGQQTYIIYMDKTKIIAHNDAPGSAKQWFEYVNDSVSQVSQISSQDDEEEETPPQELLYVYETAISGFSDQLSPKQLESLKNLMAFNLLHLMKCEASTPHAPLSFLAYDLEKGLWNASDLASDVIIGIVDTRIWPKHASFKDSRLPKVPSR